MLAQEESQLYVPWFAVAGGGGAAAVRGAEVVG
jgi:hypothetical protein